MAPRLSVVVPAFNEAENLAELVAEVRAALDPLAIDWELLVVDDGSSDPTPSVLASLAGEEARLRPFRLSGRHGQSAALAAGFARARGQVVVTLDADLQNDPQDIPSLLAALDGCDVVSGVRRQRRDDWLRRVSSRIANRVRDAVLRDGISDVGCSLKAYRHEVLQGLPAFDGLHRFLPALARMQGARIREVAVSHRPRRRGVSKYGVHNRLWRGLADLCGVRWLQRRWVGRVEVEPIAGDGCSRR